MSSIAFSRKDPPSQDEKKSINKRRYVDSKTNGSNNNKYEEKPKYGHGKFPQRFQMWLFLLVVLLFASLLLLFCPPRRPRRNVLYRTEPPAHLHVSGSRSSYTPVPPNKRKVFYVQKDSFRTVVIRAFRNRGWKKATEPEDAHLVYTKGEEYHLYNEGLQPWQRYNHFPGRGHWDWKSDFAKHFMQYKAKNPTKTFYLPVTYRLSNAEDRATLQGLLLHGGGMNQPWVVKDPYENNGKGIDMFGPNSPELKELAESMEKSSEIVQAYICNELTWRRKQKFDLRFYWMVASMDPLIVLYHDGYVRVGNAEYNEHDWSSTTQHLTTHTYLADEEKGTIDELEEWLQDYYNENKARLSKRIKDPVVHVRNQLKEMIAQTADCFKEYTFGVQHAGDELNTENGYAIYGFDSILDKDLDAWYIEAQAGPGMEEEFDFRVEMHRDLLRTMIDIVAEIQTKQETNARANLLPIDSLGGWEIVYAGDWMFENKGYQRVPQHEKQSCGVERTDKTKPNITGESSSRLRKQ